MGHPTTPGNALGNARYLKSCMQESEKCFSPKPPQLEKLRKVQMYKAMYTQGSPQVFIHYAQSCSNGDAELLWETL